MSRNNEFFHGTSRSNAENIMKHGFLNVGSGDFGRGDYFASDADWAGDYAGFPQESGGRIVRAIVTPKNPLVHEHGDAPKHLVNQAVKKAREIWPKDERIIEEIKAGHEYAMGEMAGHLGYDAYHQPSGLLVTKAKGVAHPVGTLNLRQFHQHQLDRLR